MRAAGAARRAVVRLEPGSAAGDGRCRSPRTDPTRGAAWSRSSGSSGTAGPASAGGCAHTFQIPGSYRVMLRSTDSWGNWAFAARTVHIRGTLIPATCAASGTQRPARGRRRRSAGGRSPGSGRTTSRGSAGSASRAASRPAAAARRAGISRWHAQHPAEGGGVRGAEGGVAAESLGRGRAAGQDRRAAPDRRRARSRARSGSPRRSAAGSDRPSRPRSTRRPRRRRAARGGSSCPGSGRRAPAGRVARRSVGSRTWKRGSNEPTPIRTSSPAGKLQP